MEKEWFYYEEDIVKGFKELQESDLLEYLWNYRKEILNLTYFKSDKLLREITNKLYSNRTRENLDYQNKYDVLWDIEHLPKNISSSEVEIFVIKFNSLRRFDERLILYCETEISDDVRKMIDPQISIEYSNFYKSLGPSVCKAKAYKRGELQKEYDNRYVKESNNSFIDLINSEFPISNSDGSSIFYPNKDIKQKLQKIYVKHEITEKAKATDIIRFFEVNEVIKRIGKQIIRGYYLLKFKLQ